MKFDVVQLLARMAETGTAPQDGCTLFGVGYEGTFESLRETYLVDRFNRGRAAEKFVVGPFGSGKTHFVRQLMEIARDLGCVTSEVQLNKDVDFTKNLLVYQEVVRDIRVGTGGERGIAGLIRSCLDEVQRKAEEDDDLVRAWIEGVDKRSYRLQEFGYVMRLGLEAHRRNDEERMREAERWLSGSVTDAGLARKLNVSRVTRQQEGTFGRRALHSLFQFVRHASLHGTVLTFGEAEQGFDVDRRRRDRIFSVLQSEINAIADLEDGPALIIYAFTPDMLESMDGFPALQQRVRDPGSGMGFFDGNVHAPVISLDKRKDAAQELVQIGTRLVSLLYERSGIPVKAHRAGVEAAVKEQALQIAKVDESASNRRTMIKQTCTLLLNALEGKELTARSERTREEPEEDEV